MIDHIAVLWKSNPLLEESIGFGNSSYEADFGPGGLKSDFPSGLTVVGKGSAFSYPWRGDFQDAMRSVNRNGCMHWVHSSLKYTGKLPDLYRSTQCKQADKRTAHVQLLCQILGSLV